MLEIRPNCECCDRTLRVDDPHVLICTFECTWCQDCATAFPDGLCPNCGGNLTPRPIRPAALLPTNPPSQVRVHNPTCAAQYAYAAPTVT